MKVFAKKLEKMENAEITLYLRLMMKEAGKRAKKNPWNGMFKVKVKEITKTDSLLWN